jgi:hypothetical protein
METQVDAYAALRSSRYRGRDPGTTTRALLMVECLEFPGRLALWRVFARKETRARRRAADAQRANPLFNLPETT